MNKPAVKIEDYYYNDAFPVLIKLRILLGGCQLYADLSNDMQDTKKWRTAFEYEANPLKQAKVLLLFIDDLTGIAHAYDDGADNLC